MSSRENVQEEIQTGGGATGVSKIPGPVAKGKAGLPNSKDQGDTSIIKGGTQVDSGLGDGEDTSTENNVKVTGDNSGKNKSSISTKPSAASAAMKEEILGLFSGSDLSEEFKDKASTLFEAAVNARVNKEVDRLNEEFDALVEEGLAEAVEELVGKIDDYIGYIAEEWMEENALAIESGLRSEMTESFMNGLKNLFTNHYVDLPEEATDIVEELAARVVELEDAINETVEYNIELNKNLTEMECVAVLNDLCESLTDTQKARVTELAEGISYDSSTEFAKKLSIIAESVVPGSVRGSVDQLTEDSIETGGHKYNRSTNDEINNDVQMYAAAISKTVKR
jgi:hypothetical protein